jgi:hypothetical protein
VEEVALDMAGLDKLESSAIPEPTLFNVTGPTTLICLEVTGSAWLTYPTYDWNWQGSFWSSWNHCLLARLNPPCKTDDPASNSTTTMRSQLVSLSLVGYILAQGFSFGVQETATSFPPILPLGRNVTEMHLSEFGSTGEFTTLVHPKFPHHQVRVKKTDFCDPTVGFVYSFFRRNPT